MSKTTKTKPTKPKTIYSEVAGRPLTQINLEAN